MESFYLKKDSFHLGRPMEYKRFGRSGRPVVVFPTSGGRFFQYEDSGAVAALSDFIDDGRIQIFTLDGIDGETFLNKSADLQARIGRHDAYFRYVLEEALPDIARDAQVLNGGQTLKPLLTGCSMGAFHASNFLFHYPESVAGVIALSGVYSTRDFFGPGLGGGIYYHSPVDYLAGLDDQHVLDAIRADRLIFCCGRGRWEERMLADTHRLEEVLIAKNIPAWVDYWGSDVDHDWPWWHKQLRYFMGHWLDDDARHSRG